MDTEQRVFACKSFEESRMEAYGFEKTENGHRYKADFMGGDFLAVIEVANGRIVFATVIDKMNDEEYTRIRSDGVQSGYVSAVREAYEALLRDIAENCCTELPFNAEQSNRISKIIADRYKVVPDYPWGKGGDGNAGVFRHPENSKWFALIMTVRKNVIFKNEDQSLFDIVNLKAAPAQIPGLIKNSGVFPAYHMNRKHWISLLLDDTLDDASVMELIDKSFRLTAGGKGRRVNSGDKEKKL